MQQSLENSSTIDIRGLVKKYHYRAILDHLSLTIEDGAFCVLVGANGAGKTTLLRILATLIRPDQGEVSIAGVPLFNGRYLRQKIGYVGHQPMFYHDLTAGENLQHYARLYQIENADRRIKLGLQSVGLLENNHAPVRTFSRGMQQRMSIARALLHEPKILLFDEPYTGLDQEAIQILDEQLKSLHQPGTTILLAAHQPQRLIPFASHIAWLKNGKIKDHIATDHLEDAPALQAYLKEV
jgi:heme exporter protein A